MIGSNMIDLYAGREILSLTRELPVDSHWRKDRERLTLRLFEDRDESSLSSRPKGPFTLLVEYDKAQGTDRSMKVFRAPALKELVRLAFADGDLVSEPCGRTLVLSVVSMVEDAHTVHLLEWLAEERRVEAGIFASLKGNEDNAACARFEADTIENAAKTIHEGWPDVLAEVDGREAVRS